jgi:hypothetical protein
MTTALCQFFASLFSRWALLAVLLGVAITLGVHQASGDLAGTVFTANATFVALIVPAAALANTLLEDRLLSYVDKLVKLPEADKAEAAKAASSLGELAKRLVEVVEPVVRGFAFLLFSFGISIAALFHPNHHIWAGAGWWKVNLEDMLLGGALGFDVVAILLFLPFVWLLLDQKLAKDTRDLITGHAARLAQEAAAPAPVPAPASTETGKAAPAA